MTKKKLIRIIKYFDKSYKLLLKYCLNEKCENCPFKRETHCGKMLNHADNVNYIRKQINKGEKNAGNK